MPWLGRFRNQFRSGRITSDLDEELASHIDEAVAQGRSAEDARRALGGTLLYRERSQDIRLLPWLDGLASDVVFGWRQLKKNRVVSAAAVLSLALAIGATAAAFRLVDAVLWRTLPVAAPERLSYLAVTNFLDRDGHPDYDDAFDYPTFRQYRQIVGDRADLMLVGTAHREDDFLDSGEEPESVYRQFVSGNFFGVLGIQPALGRLLTPNDDRIPGGHPVTVLSHDYWTRRFGRDPNVLGKTLRLGKELYEIVGVAARGFTGTEPGVVTDVFIPSMMHPQLDMEIVGYVRDASYDSLREPVRPTVYVPLDDQSGGTFIVRTAGDPLALAPVLRREISQARSEFHVRSMDTQGSFVRRQMIRERLLATLSMFFASVALVLAAVGLYGVLNYSVVRQRREIGIRLALGARSVHVVRGVTAGILGMVFLGLAIGLAGGLASGRFIETLLFEVKMTDLGVVVAPLLTLLTAALLAALPPAIRAVRIDPAQTLRSE